MIHTLSLTVRIINKHRNHPDPVIDTVRVINKHGNDPDSVTDTVIEQ